jgi:hypothetical protein
LQLAAALAHALHLSLDDLATACTEGAEDGEQAIAE